MATSEKRKGPDNEGKSRRSASIGFGIGALLLLAVAFAVRYKTDEETRQRTPNLILISIDTLRADHLGCYGYDRPTSPVLDQFAAEGVLFEDVTSPSPWTLPAHASLLTGVYPFRHGMIDDRGVLSPELTSLSEILKGQGYFVCAVVNSIFLDKPRGLTRDAGAFSFVPENYHLAPPTEVGDRAMAWLSMTDHEPFFLFLHYYDVHSDYVSLPAYEEQFLRPYQGPADGTTAQMLLSRKGYFSFNQADIERNIDLYDAGIRQLDAGIGELLELLEEEGLLEESLIVITSDHGEEFLDHGGVLHSQTHYQEVLKVPLLIRGPRIPKGKRIKELASLVDVTPTVLSLLGIQTTVEFDGIDLSPTWREGAPALPARSILAEADHNDDVYDTKSAVRRGRYKLLHDQQTQATQLYDIQTDPGEKNDISSNHPQVVKSMLSWLEEFRDIETERTVGPPLSPKDVEKLEALGYL